MGSVKLTKRDALQEYEAKQAEIKKLIRQIEAGLLKHDRSASSKAWVMRTRSRRSRAGITGAM